MSEDTEPEEQEGEGESMVPGGTESVLIVDDEHSIAHIHEMILKRLGYKVTTFTNALDALRAFEEKSGDFDVVLTDQTMPKLPGIELAKRLIAIKPGLPVILCSGHGNVAKAPLPEEIRGFLKKPADASDLARCIRDALTPGPPATTAP